VEASKTRLRQALSGQPGPEADIVAVNAGAAVYVAGLAQSLAEGVAKAQQAITSGAAMAKLEALRAFT
jgi:anthranilate phosphoribosyltransferase